MSVFRVNDPATMPPDWAANGCLPDTLAAAVNHEESAATMPGVLQVYAAAGRPNEPPVLVETKPPLAVPLMRTAFHPAGDNAVIAVPNPAHDPGQPAGWGQPQPHQPQPGGYYQPAQAQPTHTPPGYPQAAAAWGPPPVQPPAPAPAYPPAQPAGWGHGPAPVPARPAPAAYPPPPAAPSAPPPWGVSLLLPGQRWPVELQVPLVAFGPELGGDQLLVLGFPADRPPAQLPPVSDAPLDLCLSQHGRRAERKVVSLGHQFDALGMRFLVLFDVTVRLAAMTQPPAAGPAGYGTGEPDFGPGPGADPFPEHE